MSNDFILNILAALNKQMSKRQLKGDLKSMDNSLYIKVIAKLATAISRQQLKKDLKKLNDLYVQIGANVKVDKNTKIQLQNRIKELQKSLSELEINMKVSKTKTSSEVDSVRREIQAKANKAPVEFNVELKRSKAIADIEYLGKRFSKLFTNVAAKQKYENILGSAYSISDETQLKSVRNQIAAFTSELKANGLASQSLGDKWRNLLARSKNLLSAASIVTAIFSQAKQAVSTILHLDTAMTNLYKVQDQITSRDQFSGLLTKWNKLAQNLAVTTESLISSMEAWSKIGFNLDMSEQLAQITAIFEKTAEISNEKATSTLISAAQAFTEIDDLGVDDYVKRVEAVGNKINAIGNKYSISSEGIADGLQNASAALKVAGNDLNETIALITATNKVFQSPEEGANTLKVASMRLRGQVNALKEMGEDAEGVSADITKIQQQIYELTGNKVNIFEDEDTLKSTYQMILEIGEVFDSLSDRSQADLLEKMFGKQRASAGAALLLNYEELEKIKNDSMNAANSMAEEYAKYMESAEAHLTIFKEKLVKTYSAFINGDIIKYAADLGSSILDLVNSTDLLKHGILAITALKIGQGITAVGAAIATTSKQMNTLGSALQQIKNLPLDDVLREKKLKEVGEATQNLTEKNLKLLLSQKNLEDSDKIMILNKHNLTDEEARAKLQKLGLTSATNAQSAANVKEAATTNVLKGAMGSLKASIIGVGTSIKVAFLSNPIGFILTGITTIISVATTAISNHNQRLEEMRQKAKELGDSFKSTKSDIESYKSQIKELHQTINDSSSSIEDVTDARKTLMSVQDELIEKFGTEESVIRNVTDAINGQTDALDILTRTKWQEIKNEFNDGGFWSNISNFFQGTDNIERMLSEYGKKNIVLPWVEYAGDMIDITDDIVAKLENIGIDIKVSTDDLQGIRDFNSLTESIVGKKGISLYIEGNAEEVYNKILSLQNLVNGDDSFGKFYKNIERHANSYKELTDEYKDFYDQYILYEKILAEDSHYAGTFKEIADAAEKYNEAFFSGNEEEIKKASDEYASLLSTAMTTAIANGDSDIATYFENMYPTLKTIVDGWKFNVAFDANTDDLQDKVQNVLDELKDENDRSFTAEEILGLGESNAQYQALIAIAHDYNMTIEEMIELLKKRNLVSAMDYQGLVGLFGQDNVDKLSTEDLEIAYTIKNVGNMTFNELLAEIQNVKELTTATDSVFTLSASETIDQLNTKLKPAFDSLKSAWQSIFTDDGFDKEAVDIPMLKSIKSSIEEINELGINIDLSAFDEFATILTNVNVTEEQAEQAFNDLATSIFNATGATEGMTAETKELVEQLLESLGVVNASEVAEYSLAAAERELMEAKAQTILATYDLIEASQDDYAALLEEAGAAGVTKQQIYNLAAAEIAYGANDLSVEQKVQKLKILATAYGDTTTAALATAAAEKLLKGQNVDVDEMIDGLMDQINSTMNEIEIKIPKINFSGADFSGLKKKASKAGSDAGAAYVNAFEKQLSKLNSVISYIGNIIGKQISKFQSQKDAAVNAIEEQRKAAVDSLNAQKEAAESALNAQKEAQKSAIESQKSAIQSQIDAKQAEINKIKEANEARKNELDMQKKLYDLAKQENMRPKLAYSEDRGLHYTQDTKGIRDAREAITEAKENMQIASMQKELDNLNSTLNSINDTLDSIDSQIDSSNDYYDSLIDDQNNYYDSLIAETENYWDALINGLEDYKTRWEELADIEEQAKMEVALKELGLTTDDILNMSESAFELFKENYLNVLKEMYSGNDEMINMLQELGGVSTESLQPLSDTLSDVAVEVDEVASSVETLSQTTKEEIGESGGDGVIGKIDEAIDKMDEAIGKIEEVIDTASTAGAAISEVAGKLADLDGMTSECTVKINIIEAVQKEVSNVAEAVQNSVNNKVKGNAHYEGTAKVTGDWSVQSNEKDALVGEEGYEIIVRDGRFFTVGDNGPEMFPIKKGDIVFNHKQSEELLKNGHTSERGKAYADGTDDRVIITPDGRVLRHLQPGDRMYDMLQKWNKYFDNIDRNIEKLTPNSSYERNMQMGSIVNHINNVTNNKNTRPVQNYINVTCPGVTEQQVAERLGSVIGKELDKQFNGLHLEADQRSRIR